MPKTETEIIKEISNVLNYLEKQIKINSAVLFGSAVTGKMDDWSDIDLAIFSEDVESWSFKDEINMISQIQNVCSSDVEPHFYPASVLTEARPTNFWGHILITGRKII